MRLLRNLERPTAPSHAVVALDLAILLCAQRVGRTNPSLGDEGAARLGRRLAEAAIELTQEDVAQLQARRCHAGQPANSQLLWKPALQRAEGAFRPAPRLGRLRGVMPDAKPRQLPAHLGEVFLVHPAARLRREEVARAALGVEDAKQAVSRDGLRQPCEAR